MTLNDLIEFKIGETVIMHLLRIGVSDTLYVNQKGSIFLKEEHSNSYQQVSQLRPEVELNSPFCRRNYDLILKRMEQLESYEKESGNFTNYNDWRISLYNNCGI